MKAPSQSPATDDRPQVTENRHPRPAPSTRRSATYHQVDTCAAEFAAFTPYLYSSYESESEAPPTARDKVIILGGGPNRIGQGIEFDYCCCHAQFRAAGDGLRDGHDQLQPGDGQHRL